MKAKNKSEIVHHPLGLGIKKTWDAEKLDIQYFDRKKRKKHLPICFSMTKLSETTDEIAKRTTCACGKKNCRHFKKHLNNYSNGLKTHPLINYTTK